MNQWLVISHSGHWIMRKKFVWGFYPGAVGHIWLRLTHIWPIPNGMCKYLVRVVYFDVFNLFALFLWIHVTKKKKKKSLPPIPVMWERLHCTLSSNSTDGIYTIPSCQTVWYHKAKVTLFIGAHTESQEQPQTAWGETELYKRPGNQGRDLFYHLQGRWKIICGFLKPWSIQVGRSVAFFLKIPTGRHSFCFSVSRYLDIWGA